MSKLRTICLLAWAVVTHADATLSLQDAVSAAMQFPSVLSAQSRQAEMAARSKASAQLPDLKLGIQYAQDMTLMQEMRGPMPSIMLSQTIDFPSRYALRADSAKADEVGAKAELTRQMLQARGEVIRAYFNVQTALMSQDVLRKLLATVSALIDQAKARQSSGTGDASTISELLATKEELEDAASWAKIQEEQGYADLRLLEGDQAEVQMPMILPKMLKQPERDPAPNTVAVQIAKADVSRQKARADLAFFDYFPNLTLSFEKPLMNAKMSAFSLTAEINVPIWFWLNQAPNLDAANRSRQAAEQNLLAQSRIEQRNLHNQWLTLEGTTRTLQRYQDGWLAAKEHTLTSLTARFSARLAPLSDVLNALKALEMLQLSFLDAVNRHIEAIVALETELTTPVSDLPFLEMP